MVAKIIDVVVYLLLLGLGLYFIRHGAIFERFLKKRTQFAEFFEDIIELPTILTFVTFKENLKYGSHFNISLMIESSALDTSVLIESTKSEGTNLTHGHNTVHNSLWRVNFEEQKEFSSNIGDEHKFTEKRQVRLKQGIINAQTITPTPSK